MQKYQNNVTNNFGVPIQGASVLVTTYPAGATATIYSDNGVTAQPNPMTTNNLGSFAFYAADGHYSLQITGAGILPLNITDLLLSSSQGAGGGPDSTGTTAQRPVSPSINQQYFDTTLGEPIWCKSLGPVVWVNAAGVQV